MPQPAIAASTTAARTAPAPTPLLIRFGRVGDMAMQAPLLHLLHRRYGRPCVLFGGGPWTAALYARDPDVAAMRELFNRHTPFALSPARWQMVRALARHDGPVYVSEDVPRQVGSIRRMLALARTPAARCVFLTDLPLRSEHRVDRLLEFGGATPAAYSPDDYPWREQDLQRAPRLTIDAADRADLDRWLVQRGFAQRPIVLFQPGNNRTSRSGRGHGHDSKIWPTHHWAALLRAVHERLPQAQLLLCGSAAETGILQAIQRDSGLREAAVATHDLPLRRLLALAERAHSMVSVDTGPAHMAAAAGCPLVVLYGAESPRVWGRRGLAGKPVIDCGGPPLRASVDEISLDEVVTAWAGLAP